MKYEIVRLNGQRAIANSLREAKKIARSICAFPSKRLYWQTWCDDIIIGDYVKDYKGQSPIVMIRLA